MTTNLAETIVRLEDAFNQFKLTGRIDDIGAIDTALLALRSQEETVRRCAEIVSEIESTCGHGYARKSLRKAEAAILAAHGLKEKP